MVNSHYKIPDGIRTNSVLLGLFLMLQTIMIYLFPSAEGGVATGGMLGVLYVACVVLIIVNALKSGIFLFKKIPFFGYIIAIVLLIFYLYTQSNIGEPRTPFAIFLMFTIMAFLLPMFTRIDTRIMFRTIMLLSVPALLRFNAVFTPMIAARGTISMGYSYSFLTSVLVSVSYALFFLKYDTPKWRKIMGTAMIANIVLAFMLIMYGSRGPVVALLSMILVPYIIDFSKPQFGIHLKKGKTTMLFAFLIVVLVFLIPILEALGSFLANFNVSLNFVNKFVRLSADDNIGGERDSFYEITMYGISQKPVYGHGCDQFENVTGFPYPHNFFLQMLYDGGVLLALLIFIPLIVRLWKWKSECRRDDFIVFMTFFFASVPGAMVSGDLWQMIELWFFFGIVFSKQFVYKPILHDYR